MLGATPGDRVRRQASARKRALALWATKQGIPLVTAAHSGHAAAVALARAEQRGRRALRARERSLKILRVTPAATMMALRSKLAATLPLVEGEQACPLLCSLARDLRRVSRASPSGAELAN